MRIAYAAGCLLLGLVGGAALGVVVAVSAVAVHAWWWGLVLAVVGSVATVFWLRPGALRVGYAAGWVCVVVLASVPRGSGSYVIAGNLPGYVMLALGVAVVALALGTLSRGGAARGDLGPKLGGDIG